jgi:hypothetical protein
VSADSRRDTLAGRDALVWTVPRSVWSGAEGDGHREVWISQWCAVHVSWGGRGAGDESVRINAITKRAMDLYLERADAAGLSTGVERLWSVLCSYAEGEWLDKAIADLQARIPLAPREVT